MTLGIPTFSSDGGGNVFYKAITHPLCVHPARQLLDALAGHHRVAIYDPEGRVEQLNRVHPIQRLPICAVLVQQAVAVGREVLGHVARPITDLDSVEADAVLVTAFDANRHVGHIAHLIDDRVEVFSLDAMRLPDDWLSNHDRYLSPVNFVTNLATFRDGDGRHTRLVTANYWSGYGADAPQLKGLLLDASGDQIARIDRPLGSAGSSVVVDSEDLRKTEKLKPFDGQLFVHITGAAGHDVLKYALDTWGEDDLSCTHDANAWPSLRYGGLPTPRKYEQVTLLLQNSHPITIPPGDLILRDPAGEISVPLDFPLPPFASRALNLDEVPGLLTQRPGLTQLQLVAGGHLVRPRYQVTDSTGRTRIAHLNVIREDLQADSRFAEVAGLLGDGYLLPAPVLDPQRYRTELLVTPMSAAQTELGLRLTLRQFGGQTVDTRDLGLTGANNHQWVDVSEPRLGDGGHLTLSHHPDHPGAVDGWFHAIFRYTDRGNGHAAETSFGSHMFNGLITYRNEPQSYAGPPPGLSTRLFLRVGDPRWQTACHLIYPSSTRWHAHSNTEVRLLDGAGQLRDRKQLEIPLNGSVRFTVNELFGDAVVEGAGSDCWVMVRDAGCRLFGYHGLAHDDGRFSLDHMFGF